MVFTGCNRGKVKTKTEEQKEDVDTNSVIKVNEVGTDTISFFGAQNPNSSFERTVPNQYA